MDALVGQLICPKFHGMLVAERRLEPGTDFQPVLWRELGWTSWWAENLILTDTICHRPAGVYIKEQVCVPQLQRPQDDLQSKEPSHYL